MKKQINTICWLTVSVFFSFLLISCATIRQHPARWDKNYELNNEAKSVYWKEGTQFISEERDGIVVTISGYVTGYYNAYILATIYNDRDEYIEFYPAHSRLKQKNENFIPITPKKIRALTASESNLMSFMYGASILANTIAATSTGNVVERTYYADQVQRAGYENAMKQQQLFRQELTLLDLLLKNNAILPGESYTGYYLFQKVDRSDGSFNIEVKVENEVFTFRGKFFGGAIYDEHDLPEDIEALVFD